jgi:hypothetical protein
MPQRIATSERCCDEMHAVTDIMRPLDGLGVRHLGPCFG